MINLMQKLENVDLEHQKSKFYPILTLKPKFWHENKNN